MTGAGPLPISPLHLALATVLILAAGALSVRLALGLEKSIAVATVRTYLQLFALGFALKWLFGVHSAVLVCAILAIMVLMAAQTLLARVKSRPPGLFQSAAAALFLSGVSVTFLVTAAIIGVEPWFAPRYVIPIAGMTLGNSMNGIGVGLERFLGDLAARKKEVDALLALGANPREASADSLRRAASAALIPTLNSMSAAGVVFIPGMMSGQIIAGADPQVAAGYQIVVMLMVSAATALGSILALLFAAPKAFDGEGRLRGVVFLGRVK